MKEKRVFTQSGVALGNCGGCPGRRLMAKAATQVKNVEVDAIHFFSCMSKLKPSCPNIDVEEMKNIIEEKFGIPVVVGTHNY
ncbi:CGGC domain protein [archaeon BMS3Bbin15]|nr:CGGC domain protein [archaeon BMS3Bbin15]